MRDNPTSEKFQSYFQDIFNDENTLTIAETGVQMLLWPFCFRYNSMPWWQQTINAPSPDATAITAENVVQLLNKAAPGLDISHYLVQPRGIVNDVSGVIRKPNNKI